MPKTFKVPNIPPAIARRRIEPKLDDRTRWYLWHRNIPDAPDVPSYERVAEQERTNGQAW